MFYCYFNGLNFVQLRFVHMTSRFLFSRNMHVFVLPNWFVPECIVIMSFFMSSVAKQIPRFVHNIWPICSLLVYRIPFGRGKFFEWKPIEKWIVFFSIFEFMVCSVRIAHWDFHFFILFQNCCNFASHLPSNKQNATMHQPPMMLPHLLNFVVLQKFVFYHSVLIDFL